MKEKEQLIRPCDIKTFRTNDPDQMLGKYLVSDAVSRWTEDFIDEDTGETISIERKSIIATSGHIDSDKLQEIMFGIQSGDVVDVDVCERNIHDAWLYRPDYMLPYMVDIKNGFEDPKGFIAFAQNIPQAITIATEYGQVYRGFSRGVQVRRVAYVDAGIVPDDHMCIPEEERIPAWERKNYFKVQVREEWIEECKWKKSDYYYIVTANDVGEAKDRISLMLDIKRAEEEQRGVPRDTSKRTTVRKAMPFEVDCIVPKKYSELYKEKANEL